MLPDPSGQPPQTPTPADLQAMADLYAKFPWMFPGADPRLRVTVGEVVDKYLVDAKSELAERTFENQARDLAAFRKALGTRTVGNCTPLDLKDWLQAQENRLRSGWTRSRVHNVVQRAFNWAVNARLIQENPFRGLPNTHPKGHGRDMKLDELQALLRHTDPHFRRFLIALKLTGTGPAN